MIFTRIQNLDLYPQAFRQRFGSFQITLHVGAVDRGDVHVTYGFNQGLCPQAPLVVKIFCEWISITMTGKDDGCGRTGLGVSNYCTASCDHDERDGDT